MYKMYFLVLYNLSHIQQGIQAGHCVVEYINEYKSNIELKQRMKEDKTFIILNGGTSKTMNEHMDYLMGSYVKYSCFQEEDLGGITTCICFLAEDGDFLTKDFTPLFRLA